jgi:hypothetical protein
MERQTVRLEVIKRDRHVTVRGCVQCPLRVVNSEIQDANCAHPDARWAQLAPPEMFGQNERVVMPDWCPLRSGDLVVRAYG